MTLEANGREIIDTETDTVVATVDSERLTTLFAAAPELLEALRGLVNAERQRLHGERTHTPAELWRAAEVAIAKAEGES